MDELLLIHEEDVVFSIAEEMEPIDYMA